MRSDALSDALIADQVFTAENSVGVDTYNADRRQVFVTFVRNYIAHYNEAGPRNSLVSNLSAPRQFWSFPHGTPYKGQERIVEVAVNELTTLYDEQDLSPIRDIELIRIKFAPPEAK